MTEKRLFQKTVEFLVLRSHYSTHFNMHGARHVLLVATTCFFSEQSRDSQS